MFGGKILAGSFVAAPCFRIEKADRHSRLAKLPCRDGPAALVATLPVYQ
jgi:hypothetical protein